MEMIDEVGRERGLLELAAKGRLRQNFCLRRSSSKLSSKLIVGVGCMKVVFGICRQSETVVVVDKVIRNI